MLGVLSLALTSCAGHGPPGAHDPEHCPHHGAAHGEAPGQHGEGSLPAAPEHGAPHAAPGAHGAGHGQGAPLVHRFDEAEDWASRFERPERDAIQKPAAVVAAMKLTPGMTVADLGTGTGYFLPYLSPAVGGTGRVLAIDIEPSMVRYVRDRAERDKLGNVEPRLALVDDPLMAPATADRLLIVNTWHHIPERARYVPKLVRALRDGGSVWVVDYKLDAPDGPPPEHRLAPETVAAELGAAGLETRIDIELLPQQYVVVGTRAQRP